MAFVSVFYKKTTDVWHNLNKIAATESWIYVTDEQAVSDLYAVFATSLSRGKIVASEDLGFRDNVFRLSNSLQKLKELIEKEQPKTLFLEMTWVVRTPSGSIYLRDFLIELQKLITHNPQLITQRSIFCLYNESLLLDEQLLMALQAHPLILTQKGVQQNPYFLPPSIFKNNAPRAQFDYYLSQIDDNRTVQTPEIPPSVKKPFLQPEDHTPIYYIEKPLYTGIAQSDEGRWKIRCLGDLKVYRENGVPIDFQTKTGATKKVKTLFVYLLFRGEKGASVEELSDLLWSDNLDMTQTANRLYHTIRSLREVLEGKTNDLRQSPFILQQNNRYYLTLPPDSWIDLPMFQELCFKGNAHFQEQQFEQALIAYQGAERLYQGDLLTNIPTKYTDNTEQDWCWSRRFWYRDMHHKLLHSLATIHRQLGKIPEALSYADKAIAVEPSSEPAHREKLLALKAANRLDAVHRQYRLYVESLKKFDLGAPSREMKALYGQMLS